MIIQINIRRYFILILSWSIVALGTAAYACESQLKALPPLVSQQTDYSCGPASLLSWLLQQNITTYTEENLIDVLNTNPQAGTSLTHFLAGLSRLEISATNLQNLSVKTLRHLYKSGFGIILNVQSTKEPEDHYVLLASMSETQVKLMDPDNEYDYLVWSIQDFVKNWHGGDGVRSAILLSKPSH